MNYQITLLLDLQDIDQQIAELQGQLNLYPGIWEEVLGNLRAKTQKFDEVQAANTNYASDRKKTEQELRLCSEKLKHYQAQQMLVKSSKELAAISAQIDNAKKAIAKLEERGLALINDEESLKQRLVAAKAELAEAKAAAKTERERIREQVSRKKSQIEVLEKSRMQVLGKVESSALALYDRTRKRWNLNPVVAVRHGSCTGCHFALLPNKLVALHKDDVTVCCDNCGRILSRDETFSSAEQPVG